VLVVGPRVLRQGAGVELRGVMEKLVESTRAASDPKVRLWLVNQTLNFISGISTLSSYRLNIYELLRTIAIPRLSNCSCMSMDK
jgi:hypothetical protein